MSSKKLEIIAEPGKTSFTTRRIVDAPRALVFDAFTKCEHLKNWMGPKSLTMVSCESDLRAGGRYRFVFRAPRRRGARDPRAHRSGRQDDDHDDHAAQDRGESRRPREQRHGSRHDGRIRAARRAARRPSAGALTRAVISIRS